MAGRVRYRELDWFLLGVVLLVASLGLLEVYSTTATHPRFANMHLRQLAWVGLGLLVMFIVARLDYHSLLDQAPLIYLATLGGLVAVLFFGRQMFGARRWLEFGGLTFQVSEVAKWSIIIVLAKYLGELRSETLTPKDLAKVAVLAGVPAALIAAQPDLGTALTLAPIAASGAFLSGLRWKHIAVLALAGLLVLPAGWFLLRPYQRERVVAFLNPGHSPQGSGYQTLQSKIAVGSGGFWGKGMGKGSQNQLGFIPVRHAEFIVAAYAEEQGFAGVLLALSLYLILLLRLLHIAETAADRPGALLVAGVFSLLAFHLLVNVGMVIGWMPVTGIPLPLLSYGGSATLSTFMMLGLVMSVRLRRFVNL
ncbi:MAG: rod shape-determining protein RodA [Acidobacteria bacterium]|nr:rod shape-determining protein RodA [Acidobacteriota bacterium]